MIAADAAIICSDHCLLMKDALHSDGLLTPLLSYMVSSRVDLTFNCLPSIPLDTFNLSLQFCDA
jgi:hypothetical protein